MNLSVELQELIPKNHISRKDFFIEAEKLAHEENSENKLHEIYGELGELILDIINSSENIKK